MTRRFCSGTCSRLWTPRSSCFARTFARSRDAEEASYWEDYKVVGRLFGLRKRDMPETIDDLDAYGRRMLEGDELLVTPWARERAREIVLAPPVP